jgi:hypothetical protein
MGTNHHKKQYKIMRTYIKEHGLGHALKPAWILNGNEIM